MVIIDIFELGKEAVPSISEYFFSSFNKAIIEGRKKKRKLDHSLDIPSKQLMA